MVGNKMERKENVDFAYCLDFEWRENEEKEK